MEIDEIKKILKEEVAKNNVENIHFVIKQIDSLFNNKQATACLLNFSPL